MLVERDRIIDDGEVGFSFPIFMVENPFPSVHIDEYGVWKWYTLPLTPGQELEILEEFLSQNRRMHVLGWSSGKIVSRMREYYLEEWSYDPIVKQCTFLTIPRVTLGSTIDTLAFSENMLGKKSATHIFSPPIRTTTDRKEIIAGVNEGIISTVDLSELYMSAEEKVSTLLYDEYISPFRLGQIISYGYQRIGGEEKSPTPDRILSVQKRENSPLVL